MSFGAALFTQEPFDVFLEGFLITCVVALAGQFLYTRLKAWHFRKKT
jgi:hypothetical protein